MTIENGKAFTRFVEWSLGFLEQHFISPRGSREQQKKSSLA